MMDLDWPREFMVKEPTLLRRMTSGMEGKMRQAERLSRSGATTSTTYIGERVGGWVGGWVGEKETEAVGLSYCELGVWVNGWGRRRRFE